MSLEKAIEENTAVMRELIAVMSGAAGATATPAAATATAAADKPRREKKQTEGEAAALKLRMVDLLLVFDYAMCQGDPVRQPSGLKHAFALFQEMGPDERRAWAKACQVSYGFK